MSDGQSPPVPNGTDERALVVTAQLSIPRAEIVFRASRAGGPGGQHVNTSSTRVELTWNLLRSVAPSDAQRSRLSTTLASRLDGEGNVRVVASDSRSQRQNRESAERRLVDLVRRALAVPKVRRATKPTRASKEQRLEGKKRQSQRKRDRRGDDL